MNWSGDARTIVGIDEVGRGAFAGPVVAAAVILPPDFCDDTIIDSKKLSEKRRESIARHVHDVALAVGFGVVCSTVIDTANILKATKHAMHLALSRLGVPFDHIIIDAVPLKHLSVPFEHPNRGEDYHPAVAAASIIAKVYRDGLMKKLHLTFPEYGWYGNKGYGSPGHIAAIGEHGLTPLHRRSFCEKYETGR